MKGEVDKTLREEQAGFRQDRSCTDQIATLRIVIEHRSNGTRHYTSTLLTTRKPLTVWTGRHFGKYYGVPMKLVNMIKNSYEGMSCRVIHDGQLTKNFEIRTSVRRMLAITIPFHFSHRLDHENRN